MTHISSQISRDLCIFPQKIDFFFFFFFVSGFDSWVGKIPWRRAWQPTAVVLPGESPWTEEPGWLQSSGSQRVKHDWTTKHSTQVIYLNKLNLGTFCYFIKIMRHCLPMSHTIIYIFPFFNVFISSQTHSTMAFIYPHLISKFMCKVA